MVAVGLWSCGDDADSGQATGGADGGFVPECEPLDDRVCDCPIGTGKQTCDVDGFWSDCFCPVGKAVLTEDAMEVKVDDPAEVEVTDDSITFPRGAYDHLMGVEPGTVLVSFDGAGFLGRVVQVNEKGNQIEVITTPAKLSDAFDELEVEALRPVNMLGSLPPEAREMLMVDKAGGSRRGNTGTFGTSAGLISFSGSGSAQGSFDVNDLSFGFSPYVDIAIDYDIFGLDEFRFIAGLNTSSSITIDVALEGSGSLTGEIELIEAVFAAIGRPLPDPPYYIVLGAGFDMTVEILVGCTLEAAGEIGYETTINLAMGLGGGVHWSGGRLRPATYFDPTFSASVRDITWGAEASITCSVKPQVGLRFLRTVTGAVSAGPWAQAGVSFDPGGHSFDVKTGLDGDVSLSVALDLEFFTWEIASASWPLFRLGPWHTYHYPFSICGDRWRHLDEECDPGLVANANCTADCECQQGYAYNGTANCVNPIVCGNGVVDGNDVCDDSLFLNGRCGFCARDCSREMGVCGDGIVECGEVCDDGNQDDCDACPNNCAFHNGGCGDGILHTACGETCDDGNTDDGDTCSSQCQSSRFCGDGIVGEAEVCDDGDTDDCDECSNSCLLVGPNVCGDGRVCGTEECDYLGEENGMCDADCTFNVCGDGYVNTYEACDPGPDGPTTTCNADCTIPRCGDGVVNPALGEECDTFGKDDYDCDADCTLVECGDGYVNSLVETCDEGSANGCSPTCNTACTGPSLGAVCGDGIVLTGCGEVCDDGPNNGTCGACDNDCAAQGQYCGDGNVDDQCGEVCDDGNTDSGDGCRGDCAGVEVCGDLLIDDGEVCDDGNTEVCQGPCNETCTALYTHVCGDGSITGCEVCEDTTTNGIDMGCDQANPHCAGCGRCAPDVCGDGIQGPSEFCEREGTCADPSEQPCTRDDLSACDAGTTECWLITGHGYCEPTCQAIEMCGDSVIHGSETCDEGGNTSTCIGCQLVGQ